MGIIKELHVIYDHYKFKLLKKTKPLTVHTEAIFNDKVWEKVQEFVKSGRKVVWFVITPANYEYAIGEIGLDPKKISKEQYSKILLERYKWLQENGQEIQLHVHTIRFPEMYMSKEGLVADHESKIKEALEWLRNNGFNVTKIVFGWWSYNGDSIDVAKKYGLETVREMDHWFTHDFDMLRSDI